MTKGTNHLDPEWHCPKCAVTNASTEYLNFLEYLNRCEMCDNKVFIRVEAFPQTVKQFSIGPELTPTEGIVCEGMLCARWYCMKCFRSVEHDRKSRDPHYDELKASDDGCYCPNCYAVIKRERRFNCIYCGFGFVKGPMTLCCENDCETASHTECKSFPADGAGTDNSEGKWTCLRCADGKRICSACKRLMKKSSTDKCKGVCGKWFCEECGNARKMLNRIEDDGKGQKVIDKMAHDNCADCRRWNKSPDEDEMIDCLICGFGNSKGFMAVCKGECSRSCHVKCMGYFLTNFGDHENWYCVQCCAKNVAQLTEEKLKYKSREAAIIQHINISHMLDQRNRITPGVVQKLASGEWDGYPFVVQIVQILIGRGDESIVRQLEGSAIKVESQTKMATIVITDGQYITRVELGLLMTPMLKEYGGEVEELSMMLIEECDYKLKPDTNILNKVPGK